MNSWIAHVKSYQSKHNCSWKEALSGAKNSYTKQQGKGKKIVPMLVNDDVKSNPVFAEPNETKQPKAGSDEWYKKKEKSSNQTIQSLIDRIEQGVGKYGKAKYKKAYKASDITQLSKKKKKKKKQSEDSDEEEIVINKKKKKNKSLDQLLKNRKEKWKQLFKDNQVEKAKCKPNQILVEAYCRTLPKKK
jgi:hypothetical protein